MKPYAEACDRNRDAILKVLAQWFTVPGSVLEIGSGTGQHAVYFAAHLPHLQWIASDREGNLQGIHLWMQEARLPNLRGPLLLDVTDESWPVTQIDYVFSANTAHIMSWPQVQTMFARIGGMLRPGGFFCLYGPFNADGQFTSESNREFDAMLRRRDPQMGLRDDRALLELARTAGLEFSGDYAMPANNRTLVWMREKK